MGPKRDRIDYNPFPGLRPFSTEDSDLFFGREIEIGEVFLNLLNRRYVTITGASGTGKSSLVNAGIIPKFLKSSTPGSALSRIISFKPGNDPFASLASALSRSTGSDISTVLPDFQGYDNFHDVFKKIFPGENILLFIDQLEDLFRIHTPAYSGPLSLKFIDALIKTLSRPETDLFVIITLRSEYLGECSRYKGLARFVNGSNYLLPEPGVGNLREIIEGLVKYAGAEIDPELSETLINEVIDKHEHLSLLQHAMMRTWSHWKGHCDYGSKIGRGSYDYIGTIQNGVSIHANEIYESLTDRGKKVCESMFRTITRRGSDNKGLRHPSDIGTIRSVAGCTSEELYEVAEKFRKSANSFITPGEDEILGDNILIDIQTDCLLYSWNRLREWIDAEASSADVYLRLSEASALYHQGKTGLYRPPELQTAINWREENKPGLEWAAQYNPAFERAMVYLRTSERTYIEEEENKERIQKKSSKRSGIIAAIFGIFLLAAAGLIGLQYLQKSEAKKLTLIAEKLRSEAEKQKSSSDSTAIAAINLKAVSDSGAAAALREAKSAREQQIVTANRMSVAERNVTEALIQKNQAIEDKNLVQRMRMLSVGKSMSLKSLQLAGQKDLQSLLAYQAYLFNKRNHGPENDADIYAGLYNVALQYGNVNFRSFKGHEGDVRSIAFVPGKKEFFTAGDDGQILKWSLDKMDQTLQVIYSGSEIIDVLAVSPDASWLACGGSNSSIRMIPLKGNSLSYEMEGHNAGIKSLIFSYDGKYLYSAALDGKVFKWDIAAKTSMNVTTGSMEISSIDISSGGNYLAGVSSDGNVLVWNPDNGSQRFRIETAGRSIKVVRFNPANNILAIGDAEGNVDLWDIEKHKMTTRLKAHDAQVNDIRFNARLNQMATTGNDRKVKVFDVKDAEALSNPPLTIADNGGFVIVIQFSPDGHIIISGKSGEENNLISRPVTADYLAKDMCNNISRNMTQDEWNYYVGKDIPLEKTCPVHTIKVEPVSNK
jgi:hypothetical protein